jgi:hypothetical protein
VKPVGIAPETAAQLRVIDAGLDETVAFSITLTVCDVCALSPKNEHTKRHTTRCLIVSFI